MQRLYTFWNSYVTLVVGLFTAYCDRTDHLPPLVSMAGLLVPMLAANYFLPRWCSLSIFAALGLPLAWFLGTMICVFFTYHHRQSGR